MRNVETVIWKENKVTQRSIIAAFYRIKWTRYCVLSPSIELSGLFFFFHLSFISFPSSTSYARTLHFCTVALVFPSHFTPPFPSQLSFFFSVQGTGKSSVSELLLLVGLASSKKSFRGRFFLIRVLLHKFLFKILSYYRPVTSTKSSSWFSKFYLQGCCLDTYLWLARPRLYKTKRDHKKFCSF